MARNRPRHAPACAGKKDMKIARIGVDPVGPLHAARTMVE
jgi:hypothetical protein